MLLLFNGLLGFQVLGWLGLYCRQVASLLGVGAQLTAQHPSKSLTGLSVGSGATVLRVDPRHEGAMEAAGDGTDAELRTRVAPQEFGPAPGLEPRPSEWTQPDPWARYQQENNSVQAVGRQGTRSWEQPAEGTAGWTRETHYTHGTASATGPGIGGPGAAAATATEMDQLRKKASTAGDTASSRMELVVRLVGEPVTSLLLEWRR